MHRINEVNDVQTYQNSISRCPIIWHELHELRELRNIIKDLQRERRKTKRELHELRNIIKDLRANRAFMNQVNEVGAVERGYNEADKVDAVNFVDWVLTRRDAVAYYEPHPYPITPFYKVGVPSRHTLSPARTIRKKVKYRNPPPIK